MFDLYREINCPLLLFNAVDPLGGRSAPMGPFLACRIERSLPARTDSRPRGTRQSQGNVTVKTIEGTHGLLLRTAAAITTATLAFLDGSRARHLRWTSLHRSLDQSIPLPSASRCGGRPMRGARSTTPGGHTRFVTRLTARSRSAHTRTRRGFHAAHEAESRKHRRAWTPSRPRRLLIAKRRHSG